MLIQVKKLTLSLLFIGLSSSAWSQAVLVKSQQKIEEYKLDNGFRVILAQNDKESRIGRNFGTACIYGRSSFITFR